MLQVDRGDVEVLVVAEVVVVPLLSGGGGGSLPVLLLLGHVRPLRGPLVARQANGRAQEPVQEPLHAVQPLPSEQFTAHGLEATAWHHRIVATLLLLQVLPLPLLILVQRRRRHRLKVHGEHGASYRTPVVRLQSVVMGVQPEHGQCAPSAYYRRRLRRGCCCRCWCGCSWCGCRWRGKSHHQHFLFIQRHPDLLLAHGGMLQGTVCTLDFSSELRASYDGGDGGDGDGDDDVEMKEEKEGGGGGGKKISGKGGDLVASVTS